LQALDPRLVLVRAVKKAGFGEAFDVALLLLQQGFYCIFSLKAITFALFA
jgi:hypothetical protein